MKEAINSQKSFIGNMSYFPYEEKEKLDLKDKKILFELSINPRFSYSTIAKKVNLPRETVAYRVEQLRKKKILTGSITVINPKAFDFISYEVYFKLKNFSNQSKTNIIEYLVNNQRIRWVVECGGKWDLGIVILSRSLDELYNLLNEIKIKIKQHLEDFTYFPTLLEDFTYYGFFIYEKDNIEILKRLKQAEKNEASSFQKEFLESKIKLKQEKFKLDDIDKKIIREIEIDAMIPIATLARKISVSHNTIMNRFKQLIKNNVIVTLFPMISISLLGLEWHQVFFNLEFISPSQEKSFISYCITHPYIVYYLKYVGQYNYKISIFAKNTHHLHEILSDIRKTFAEIIIAYESFIIFSQHKYSYLSKIKL